MATTMERREHHRRPSPARSISPKRNHHSSHRREKEKSPAQRREKTSDRSYNRDRNRGGEKEKDRARERKDGFERGSNRERERVKERDENTKPIEKESVRSSERNGEKEDARDESPHTKRLRRSQEERESERIHQRESRKEVRDEKMEGREYVKMEERGSRKEREYVKMEERGSRKERGYERVKNGREERESRRRGSRSPAGRIEKSESRDEVPHARGDSIPRSGDHDSLTQMNAAAQELEAKEKQKPSFELSGKLAEETNKVRGVTLLFTEPQEARKPDIRWRLYVFKGGEVLNEPLYVHRQSCYLFGRERRVADIPTDHPSCSKQHAVLQYRLVEKEQPDGMMKQVVRPYLMDLESTNGSFINDNRLEARRYYELFEKDTIKFGNSSREYVLLHENSTTT